jgi:hypothetical protein
MFESAKAFSGFSVDDLAARGVSTLRYDGFPQDDKGVCITALTYISGDWHSLARARVRRPR